MAKGAGTEKEFEFNWGGHYCHAEMSQVSLKTVLDCRKFQGSKEKRMAGYVGALGEKIKKLKASTAG